MNISKLRRALIVLLLVFLLALPIIKVDRYILYVLTFIAIYIPIILGLRLTLNSGIFNLAQNTPVMLGAYIGAIGAVKFGVSFWVLLIPSGLIAAILGFIFGYLCLRVKGFYFAILSFCLLLIFRLICIQVPFLGGVGGISNIPVPVIWLPFAHIEFTSVVHFYYLSWAVGILSFLFFLRLDRSRVGRHAWASRENMELAEGSGINVTMLQTLLLAIGFFWSGISGCIMASLHRYVGPDTIMPWDVLLYLAYAVIGGLGSAWGALLGTIIGVVILELAREFKGWQHLVFGVSLLAIVMWLPGGIVSIPDLFKSKSQRF